MIWDKVSWIYDIMEIINSKTNKGIEIAVEREVPKGAQVLDCAAGTGLLSLSAAKKAGHVTCTDLSRNMLICAMKKARKRGVRNISFAKRDITALKDPDEKYDVVMAGNVLHLFDDPSVAFGELLRVTKKGGKLIIPTYLLGETNIIWKLIIELYIKIGVGFKKKFTLDDYLKFISENAEKNGCAEYSTELIYGTLPAGFAVIKK